MHAVLILLLVFSIGSPATDRQWECVDPADASCMVALNSETPAADMCSLQRSQWRWTEPHMTITAQFDLICSGVQLSAPVPAHSCPHITAWKESTTDCALLACNLCLHAAANRAPLCFSMMLRCLEGPGRQLILLFGLPHW